MSARITALLFGAALAFIDTVASSAPTMPTIERLRGCLSIDNMTKERLNCYDAMCRQNRLLLPPRQRPFWNVGSFEKKMNGLSVSTASCPIELSSLRL
jgi:hypothetical protein